MTYLRWFSLFLYTCVIGGILWVSLYKRAIDKAVVVMKMCQIDLLTERASTSIACKAVQDSGALVGKSSADTELAAWYDAHPIEVSK